MAYRTILVHVDGSAAAETRIKLAAQLTAREGGHLIGIAMSGVPRFLNAGPFDASGVITADYLKIAAERADEALDRFDAVATRFGLNAVEHRRCGDNEYAALCKQARYADLVVLGQAMPGGDENTLPPDLPQHVILHSGKPVLLVPYTGDFESLGERPLIAWNGSLEAAHAVSAAIPILQRSQKISLVVFGTEADCDACDDRPGSDIVLYLARHGIKVAVERHPEPRDIGNAMLTLAARLNADLLVMGAYGHSRFHELVLGGATRTILGTMTLPVLMVH